MLFDHIEEPISPCGEAPQSREEKEEGYWVRLVRVPGDDPGSIRFKKVMLVVYLVGLIVGLLTWTWFIETYRWVNGLVVGVVSALCLTQLLVERVVRPRLVEGYFLYIGLVFLIETDVSRAVVGYNSRMWTWFIPLLDICLLLRLNQRVSLILVFVCTVWLLVLGVEDWKRFGLYDLEILPDQESRRKAISCDSLPCERSFIDSLGNAISQVLMFLLDFYITKCFAEGLRTEHASMDSVIIATEKIALSLSRFDLTSAEVTLDASELPPQLDTAFRNILSNLEMYRPYLPRYVFGEEDSKGCCDSIMGENRSDRSFAVSRRETSFSVGTSLHRPSRVVAPTLEVKHCTFSVTNMIGSHALLAESTLSFQQNFKAYLEEVVKTYSSVNGVVGVVLGDHVHASFNAVKKCASHAKSAVDGAVMLYDMLRMEDILVSVGVSSGTASCGPLGCADLMSVGTIGVSAVCSSILQEFSRHGGYTVICSYSIYSEVSYAFDMRIVLGLVELVVRREPVYEILLDGCGTLQEPSEQQQFPQGSENTEWMYQMEERVWDTYNQAGRQYLLGNEKRALRLVELIKEASAVVSEHKGTLRDVITKKVPVLVYGPTLQEALDEST